jgi:signal transduction histidine kinase
VYTRNGEQAIPSNRELKYFQNNLAFHLSAPTYIDEKQTRFSYMLEGSGNENWSEPSTNSSINFVNLSPGEYTLRAKAIFLHGLYPAAESSFSFTILPPWWLTWWFKSLVGLFILGLVFLGLRFYINRKLELQRVVLEKKQAIEKERTRIATDMHDDLGAGLSQIKFLSEAIGMKRQKHLPIEEEVSSIRSFSDEMIDKMGEIVWALNEKNDTLNDLLSYTRSYAVEYLEQNGIKCHVDEPDNIPQLNVSGEFRRNIYLTAKESLHNIVKHAQATEVFIKIEISNWLTIQIRDNGIGINNSPKNSWGNGLVSMNNRVKELIGTFKIENMEGTLITIKVPLNH